MFSDGNIEFHKPHKESIINVKDYEFYSIFHQVGTVQITTYLQAGPSSTTFFCGHLDKLAYTLLIKYLPGMNVKYYYCRSQSVSIAFPNI